MSGRKSVNLVSMWIVVIFSVIAVTLAAILQLVYSSILNQELRFTLREQITVLADNADLQVMEPIRSEAVRRLTAKEGFSETLASVCARQAAESREIRALAGCCADVNAAIPQSSRVDIYFPAQAMTVGSEGVRFLDDKKYAVQASNYAFLAALNPEDSVWLRRVMRENGEDVPYIVYVRPWPGVFPAGENPMAMISVQEEKLYALLRKSLRTLGEDDRIFLTDFQGAVWSAQDPSFVGAQLPLADATPRAVRLQDGEQALLVESGDSTGRFTYVLAHPDHGWLRSYDSAISLWVVLCVVLLCAGMAGVLWVLVTNYARPMRRLMRQIPASDKGGEGGGIISSPSEHFLQIETALQDMNKYREEREQFLIQSRPALRAAWLNCLVSGEARYASPMPQLGVDFPHPFFQAVVASAKPSESEEKLILEFFPASAYVVAAFDSREKERVYLVNHAQDEAQVPALLQAAGEKLGEGERGYTFGVGILAATADMIPASFRCARRALSSRYFGQKSLVCVFDPSVSHVNGEDALPQIIAQLYNLTAQIRRQSGEEIEKTVDDIVSQLKASEPSLSLMRSIMLLTAAFLCKSVYDMKGAPEAVYGDDLMNVYYHIEDIGEFSSRLKRDSMTLSAYLLQESSENNRSLVEYALHHIRSMPPAELSTQAIADAMSISTGHLSRVFHQETGKKLVDYLQEVRMKHAARLLGQGEMTNEQICEAVGYSRLQYFSAKFKDYYGLTLNEYRRKCQYENQAGQDGGASGRR